ncbi:hypothetical protein MIR68_003005 [Amoeboaphelidium protococcarum]|nr:hypothetical protein MIR68_003005 [Amoeboaphelidium protococcarum]
MLQNIIDAHRKLTYCVLNPDCSTSEWSNAVGGWLKIVQRCLKTADFVSRAVASNNQSSCLVHCDDGLDGTCIVVSLAKLMMDPQYRTLGGFLTVIDQDWIQEGFPFYVKSSVAGSGGRSLQTSARFLTSGTEAAKAFGAQMISDTATAFSTFKNQILTNPQPGSLDDLSISKLSIGQQQQLQQVRSLSGNFQQSLLQDGCRLAVFTLFLDCCHQMWNQFPTEFEFNLELLLLLNDSASGNTPFSTFWYPHTNQLEADDIQLWDFILHHKRRSLFLNPVYQPVVQSMDKFKCPPLPVSSHSAILVFWKQMFDAQYDFTPGTYQNVIFSPNFYDLSSGDQGVSSSQSQVASPIPAVFSNHEQNWRMKEQIDTYNASIKQKKEEYTAKKKYLQELQAIVDQLPQSCQGDQQSHPLEI